MPPTLCHTLKWYSIQFARLSVDMPKEVSLTSIGRRYKEALTDLILQTYLPDDRQRHVRRYAVPLIIIICVRMLSLHRLTYSCFCG